MSQRIPDDLTALADLADLVAHDLLLNCPPDDWPGSAVVAGVRDAGRRLREAGRMLPASLTDVLDRAGES